MHYVFYFLQHTSLLRILRKNRVLSLKQSIYDSCKLLISYVRLLEHSVVRNDGFVSKMKNYSFPRLILVLMPTEDK